MKGLAEFWEIESVEAYNAMDSGNVSGVLAGEAQAEFAHQFSPLAAKKRRIVGAQRVNLEPPDEFHALPSRFDRAMFIEDVSKRGAGARDDVADLSGPICAAKDDGEERHV